MNSQDTQWNVLVEIFQQTRVDLGLSASTAGEGSATTMPKDTRAQLDMFLENNEFGLAWDALAALAEESNAPESVWEKLLRAAGLMRSAEQAHLAAMRLCIADSPAKQAS